MSQPPVLKPINRLLVTLCVGIGIGVGVTPLMVLIDRLDGLLIISVSSLLVAGITLISFRRNTHHRPEIGEYTLSIFNVLFLSAFIGLIGMGLYYLLELVILGIEWLIQLGFTLEIDQSNVSYIISMFLLVPFYWVQAWQSAQDIAADLTTDTAGLRSPYHYLLTVDRLYLRKNLITLLIIFIVLIVIGIWLPKVFLFLLQGFFFFGSGNFYIDSIKDRIKASSDPNQSMGKSGIHTAQSAISTFFEPGKRGSEKSKGEQTINWVSLLFEAAGWQVEIRPRTYDPDIDPLLADIDLLANQNGSAMLVDISHTSDMGIFRDIKRPSAIIQAVWLLAESRGLDPKEVASSLVLIDAQPDKTIIETCRRLEIKLVLLESDIIKKFLNIPAENTTERAGMAKRLLAFNSSRQQEAT